MTDRQARLILWTMIWAVGAYTLLQSLVVPALPVIQREFDADPAAVSWVFTAYLLSGAVATPVLGKLGDNIGRRPVLAALLVVMALGCAAAALAPSLPCLVAARVLQGIGGAVLPLSFGILRETVPPAKLRRNIGILASLASAGFGLGIVGAGPIIEVLGVSWIFWLPCLGTAFAAVGVWVVVPSRVSEHHEGIPWHTAFALALWLTSLLLWVTQGGTWGWGSATSLGLVAAFVVSAGSWLALELRGRRPLLDLSLMRNRGIWSTSLVGVIAGSGNFVLFAYLPQLLQAPSSTGYGLALTVTQSGNLMLPLACSSFVVGLISARLVEALGSRAVMVAGCASTSLAYLVLAIFHTEVWQIVLVAMLAGVGMGAIFATMSGVVVMSVAARCSGVATGMNANIRTIGGALGTAAMAMVVSRQSGPDGLPLESGYVWGFVGVAIAMGAAGLVALFIPPDASRGGRNTVEEGVESSDMSRS